MASLSGVKIGSVIICRRQHGGGFALYTVDRLTATQAVSGSDAFKIDTGLKIGTGSGYQSRHGRFATPKEIEEVGLNNRITFAKDALSRFAVTADNLEAVEALLKAGK